MQIQLHLGDHGKDWTMLVELPAVPREGGAVYAWKKGGSHQGIMELIVSHMEFQVGDLPEGEFAIEIVVNTSEPWTPEELIEYGFNAE